MFSGFGLQLDDWVLCRIYNKKGKIEKYNNTVTVTPMFSGAGEVHDYEHEHESKPEIHKLGVNDQLYNNDTSDSVSRLHHTDSSSSGGHVVSPDVTCDREVQSEHTWNELELQLDDAFDLDFDFQFNYLDDDPFGAQVQYHQMNQLSPLQDMFMYQQKPFWFDHSFKQAFVKRKVFGKEGVRLPN